MNSSYRSKPNTNKDNLKFKEDVKYILKKINQFLKLSFDISFNCIETYKMEVKEFILDLATINGQSSSLCQMFSKMANILQPFLKSSYKNECSKKEEEQNEIELLKKNIAHLENRNAHLQKKIKRMYEELQNYRQVSNRHINFTYFLKKQNIDIDTIYQQSLVEGETSRRTISNQESIPTLEKKKGKRDGIDSERIKIEYPQLL